MPRSGDIRQLEDPSYFIQRKNLERDAMKIEGIAENEIVPLESKYFRANVNDERDKNEQLYQIPLNGSC